MASAVTIGGVQVLLPDQGDTYAWGQAVKAALLQLAATIQPGPVAVYQMATLQTITTAAGATVINYDSQLADSALAVQTGVNWKFTVPVAGDYHLSGSALLNTVTGAVTRFIIGVYKNGVETARFADTGTLTLVPTLSMYTGTTILPGLVVGDVIQLYGQCVGGTSVQLLNGDFTRVALKKVL